MIGFLIQLLMLSPMISAHPVTFQGGAMLKSMVREDMSENSLTYTFHRQMAVGVEVDRLQLGTKDTTWGFVDFNTLLKRWNGEDSQANLYMILGGGSLFLKQQSEWAGKWGVQVDYETRRFYTLGQWTTWNSETMSTNYALYRLGFAPFLAGYNDLNIWAILQLDYNKDMRSEVQVTPFLRFYFKNVLWEVGASVRGNFYGQFMVHF